MVNAVDSIGWSAVGSAREILQSTLSSAMATIETLHTAHVRAPRDLGGVGLLAFQPPPTPATGMYRKGRYRVGISTRQIS